jgi:hypothetical protein
MRLVTVRVVVLDEPTKRDVYDRFDKVLEALAREDDAGIASASLQVTDLPERHG